MLLEPASQKQKWIILGLGALTNALVVAVPAMGMSVLLPEISADLGLNLVQAGVVWGIGSLPLILSSLFAGSLSDRFGPKRMMIASCLLIGAVGALRGLAHSYPILIAAVLASGLFAPFLSISNLKNARLWFSNRELGIASGMLAMGMALGFFIGSLVTATVLSPWLGGWRNVFFFFSAISMVFAIPWMLTPHNPASLQAAEDGAPVSFAAGLGHIVRFKNIWLLGIGALGVSGGVQGVLGYLPLYLRGLGWTAGSADGVLAAFHTASMLFVIPLSLLSDRMNSRKRLTVAAGLLIATGVGLLAFVRGGAIWGSAIMAGLVRDGFMALYMAMVIESPGLGQTYSGMATGFVMIFLGIGNLVAPPLGNALAGMGVGVPFLFWAALILLGSLLVGLAQEGKRG